MNCRSDCKWFEPESTWEEERGRGMYETMGEPPFCKFHGEPYPTTFPGQLCVGEYEQAQEVEKKADREPFDLPICLDCEEWALDPDSKPLNCFHIDACERAYELGQEKQLEAMQDDGR